MDTTSPSSSPKRFLSSAQRAWIGIATYVLLTLAASGAAPLLGTMLYGRPLNKLLWLALGPMAYVINPHGIGLYLAFSLVLAPLFAIAASCEGVFRVVAICGAAGVWLFAGAFGYGF